MPKRSINSLLNNTKQPKIAVFRALQIGDLLCSIPAIRSLKQALPQAEITLIGLPWSKDLLIRFDKYFDNFIEFPGFPGLPEREFDPSAVVSFITDMQKEQFDLILQMQGNGSIVNPLIELFNPKLSAGFCQPDGYKPSDLYLEYPENLHEINRHLSLMNFLGFPSQGTDLEFPILPQEEAEFYQQLSCWPITPHNYICMHVGSKSADRRWSMEKFAQVGDFVAERGYKVVLTGSSDETDLVSQTAGLMKYPSLNLAGKTTLGVAAALIKHSRLLISNDTGVSHIACALNSPSVIIFSASDPKRWAPLNQKLHKSVLKDQATVKEVIRQTQTQLRQSQPKFLPQYGGLIPL